jgi:hypothetical protein
MKPFRKKNLALALSFLWFTQMWGFAISLNDDTGSAQTFSLPNRLEVRTLHLANTGIVRARLHLSWDEDTDSAPAGTAWIMSKALPAMGGNGMDRETFESHKELFGINSQLEAGRGWIAWTFCAAPANAEMMIQMLADEALRPTWAKSEMLPRVLAKMQGYRIFSSGREEAIHKFRAAIGDANVAQLPEEPIDQDTFVALWANVRRPKKATLSVVGDIETIALKRAIHQHFGPWQGIADGVKEKKIEAKKQEWPKNTISSHGDTPEVWIAWNPSVLPQADSEPMMALLPWLLKTATPTSDQIISNLQIDQDGRWICAIGKDDTTTETLEIHIKTLLNGRITQDQLDRAIAAKDDWYRARKLYPHRALEPDVPIPQYTAEDIQQRMEKYMAEDSLVVLALGANKLR